MKIKVESSGFPPDVQIIEEKLAFVKEYKDKLGIEIDIDKVSFNPGLRHISKLALNSLWGKFIHRNNLCKYEVFSNPADYMAWFLTLNMK